MYGLFVMVLYRQMNIMAINNLFVRQSEMTKGETNLGQSKCRVFVVPWLCAHATFDVTCFLAFVRASNVTSNILLKH